MLTELLNVLKEGKTHSLQELAVMLKTDIPAVKAQLEYLERQGYIKRVTLNRCKSAQVPHLLGGGSAQSKSFICSSKIQWGRKESPTELRTCFNTGCAKSCSGCKGYSQNAPAPVMWELTIFFN